MSSLYAVSWGAVWPTWNAAFADYRAEHPELAAEFLRRMAGRLPADFASIASALTAEFGASTESIASRKASQKVLAALAPVLCWHLDRRAKA